MEGDSGEKACKMGLYFIGSYLSLRGMYLNDSKKITFSQSSKQVFNITVYIYLQEVFCYFSSPMKTYTNICKYAVITILQKIGVLAFRPAFC
jgi:hypothetical protein